MRPFIYGLVDPKDVGHVRYVGLSMISNNRPQAHAKQARNPLTEATHKVNWIRKIQSEGCEPSVLILEELQEGASQEFVGFVESCYIKSLREIGHRLTNATDGGDGCVNLTVESRVKMRDRSVAARLLNNSAEKQRVKANERWADPAERAKQSKIIKATMTPERRTAIGVASGGRKHTLEARAKISEALKGLERTDEHRANLSASRTPEVRTAISVATKRRFEDPAERLKHGMAVRAGITDETRSKIRALHLGKKRSEETKARMRTAWIIRRQQSAEVGIDA